MPDPRRPARDPVSEAYEQRTKQLYDARGALSEAVSALTAELERCREEREAALAENRGLREHNRGLQSEVEKLREYATGLEREVASANERTAAVLNMRAVRWTARPRAVLHRFRDRRSRQ